MKTISLTLNEDQAETLAQFLETQLPKVEEETVGTEYLGLLAEDIRMKLSGERV